VATEWEGNKPGRRRKKNLWTKDMTDVKIIIYTKGRMKPPLTPLGTDSGYGMGRK
jgi:hypothetical protein